MGNGEDIALPEPLRILQMALDQAGHEILPPVAAPQQACAVLVKGTAVLHLLEGHLGDQSVLCRHPRDVLPQGIPPQQMIHLGDLAHDAVVGLGVVDRLDGVLDVPSLGEEAEASAESDLAEDVEGKVVKISTQIKDGSGWSRAGAGRHEVVHLLCQNLDRVVDEGAELLHGRHAVGYVGYALLLCVHVLADLGEDVGILRRREYAIEVGLEEPLSRAEEVPRGLRGRQRDFIRGNPHDGAVLSVEIDVMPVGVARRRRSDFPEPRERGYERARVLAKG